MAFYEAGKHPRPGNDEHDTPIDFIEPIAEAVGGFDLDPCASASSDLAQRNLTKSQDGLSHDWHGVTYVNPPYSDVSDWVAYAAQQHRDGNTDLILMLVFARTSTQWYHNHATEADLLCFVEGRLTFGNGGAVSNAPSPSVLLVFGEPDEDLKQTLEQKGHVVTND